MKVLKCGTFNNNEISEETKKRMRADRAYAEAKQLFGCKCHPSAQVIGCPAYDKKKCIHSYEVLQYIKNGLFL